MTALTVKADEAEAKSEELSVKVKSLEQENLAKEQEITSLSHRNQLLEAEVEKLEKQVKELKDLGASGDHHATQNESLQRRLQLLEDEAEETDKTLRETSEKYVSTRDGLGSMQTGWGIPANASARIGYVKPMSKLATTNARYRLSSSRATSGRTSMKRWPRNSKKRTRHLRISDVRLRDCEGLEKPPCLLCIAC